MGSEPAAGVKGRGQISNDGERERERIGDGNGKGEGRGYISRMIMRLELVSILLKRH